MCSSSACRQGSRPTSGSSSATADDSATAYEARAQRLFAEGAAILDALWDDDAAMVRNAGRPDQHTPRGTLEYCHVLLRRGDVATAERAVRAVVALQETHPTDAHRGNFRWLREDPGVNDLNAVEFVLDDLIALTREHAAVFSPDLVRDARAAIALGLAEIERLDVHLSYTNIALSDIANSVLGGELLGEARFVERGARRLDEWLAFTAASGAPHEFNSPTYLAVDILRMAALVAGTTDPALAGRARAAEELLWRHAAAHYHPGLAQIAGPHSRSYFDGWSGAGGYLKLLLWRLLGDERLRPQTPYAPRDREEFQIACARAELHCPPEVLASLRTKAYPYLSQETSDARGRIDLTTYMTDAYALGSASASYHVGEPPEPSMGFDSLHAYIARDDPPGYTALYVRYIIDDTAPSSRAPDHWDQGRHVAAQHRNRAIIAYGLVPRVRPIESCKLSVRLLGFRSGDEAWCSGRRIDQFPAAIAPGDRLTLAVGDAYVALIPLEPTDMAHDAPILLRREGDLLTLDIYNYRGPPKSPWEYRSQAGAFYKGNVRNAFVIEMAARSEFGDFAAFRDHVAQAEVSDSSGPDHQRTISYASPGGAISMTYSLWDMSFIARAHDGAAYEPPAYRTSG
jgi:hypothetical protein